MHRISLGRLLFEMVEQWRCGEALTGGHADTIFSRCPFERERIAHRVRDTLAFTLAVTNHL